MHHYHLLLSLCFLLFIQSSTADDKLIWKSKVSPIDQHEEVLTPSISIRRDFLGVIIGVCFVIGAIFGLFFDVTWRVKHGMMTVEKSFQSRERIERIQPYQQQSNCVLL